jgi:hypothetical protein
MEAIIAGAFGLLIGGVGVWTGLRQLRNRAALEGWHTTEGRVIERGTYKPNMPAVSAPAFQYAPLVRYVYQVAGREFVNDCIRPKRIQLPERNTIKWAQKKAAAFPDKVTVHYNPADPAESFLVQTPKSVLYILIAASCLVLLVGALFLLLR